MSRNPSSHIKVPEADVQHAFLTMNLQEFRIGRLNNRKTTAGIESLRTGTIEAVVLVPGGEVF